MGFMPNLFEVHLSHPILSTFYSILFSSLDFVNVFAFNLCVSSFNHLFSPFFFPCFFIVFLALSISLSPSSFFRSERSLVVFLFFRTLPPPTSVFFSPIVLIDSSHPFVFLAKHLSPSCSHPLPLLLCLDTSLTFSLSLYIFFFSTL